MPVAAAVAAAVTAKMQAMDAVATNLGLSSDMQGHPQIMSKENDDVLASTQFHAESTFTSPATPSNLYPSTSDAANEIEADSSQAVAQVIPPTNFDTKLPIIQSEFIKAEKTLNENQELLVHQPVNMSKEYAHLPPPTIVTLANIEGKVQTVPSRIQTENISIANEVDNHTNETKKTDDHLNKKFIEGQEPTTIAQQENLEIKGQSARHLVMQRLMRDQPESVVVVLKNMVDPEEVDEELQGEIEDECRKYGEIEKVIIYQEKQDHSENAHITIKIFVEFLNSASAQRAKEALHKRFFGGKIVNAQIYDQELYENQDLSG